jgi:PAS domain S-box-containing protein
MEAAFNVLSLEDSDLDFEIICEQLIHAGYNLNISRAVTEQEYTNLIINNRFDIILADNNLPQFNAFEALKLHNEHCPEVPFICVSGSIGEIKAIELLKMGAVDYVLKDRPERLPFAIKRALDEAKEKANLQKAEIALKESEHRFKQVAEDAREWIWEVDRDGLFTYASPVIESLLGYKVQEVVGQKYFYDFFVPEKRNELRKAAFEIFSEKEYFRNFENHNVHKDGHILILSTTGSPVLDNKGNIVGYRGINADITERKKMLEELIIAKEKAEESDKLKTAFINNISHEIRTPLNGILGFGRFLVESELTPDVWMNYYNILQKSSNRLINTISDYMDMAKIVSGTMEVHKKDFPVQPFIRRVIDNSKYLSTEKKIGIEVIVPSEAVYVILNSDSEIAGKTLHILIDNALKFSREGSISCGYRIIPGYLEFFVHDTGIGIAPDKLEIIFDLFSQEDNSNTRGYEGSGLGLTIARGLVKLLGGSLKVTSEKGQGSEFSFTIPFNETSRPEKTQDNITTKHADSGKPMVLIAEDEETNYLYIEVIMKMLDCSYIHANNGAEAVEICRQNDKISLVLMDIKMPVMNGLEATKLIHEFRPGLPIIATTAYAQTGDEHRFIEAGCNGYLPKPVRKDNLMSVLENYDIM